MNKKQLRDAFSDAFEFANERDVDYVSRGYEFGRQWARMDAFLCSLAASMGKADPALEVQIGDFRKIVMRNENLLLDAADSNKEKPE